MDWAAVEDDCFPLKKILNTSLPSSPSLTISAIHLQVSLTPCSVYHNQASASASIQVFLLQVFLPQASDLTIRACHRSGTYHTDHNACSPLQWPLPTSIPTPTTLSGATTKPPSSANSDKKIILYETLRPLESQRPIHIARMRHARVDNARP